MSVDAAKFQFSYLSPTEKTFVKIIGERVRMKEILLL